MNAINPHNLTILVACIVLAPFVVWLWREDTRYQRKQDAAMKDFIRRMREQIEQFDAVHGKSTENPAKTRTPDQPEDHHHG